MTFEDAIYKRLQKRKDERDKKKSAADSARGPNSSSSRKEVKAAAKELGKSPKSLSGPVLESDDERFLERLTSPPAPPRPAVAAGQRAGQAGHSSDDGELHPPLPPRVPARVRTPELEWDSATEEFIQRRDSTRAGASGGDPNAMALVPTTNNNNNSELAVAVAGGLTDSPPSEAADEEQVVEQPGDGKKKSRHHRHFFDRIRRGKENKKERAGSGAGDKALDNDEEDLKRLLDELDLATAGPNKKIFSLSAESAQLSRRFLLILKDLVNGVPTAADDLKALLSDRDGVLAKHYDKLPKSMQKIVTQLPGRVQTSLAPELLTVAAEAGAAGAAETGMKGMAKKLLMPTGLADMITKPGAVITMLKAIVNALKLRWPALLGTSVIWSTALFLLLFVLWYCHKRGKEVRLDKERMENAIDGADRIEELPDDPALDAPPRTGPPMAAASASAVPRAAAAADSPPPVPMALRGANTNPM